MGIFVWFFIPETKGLSLEKMDELFGSVRDAETKAEVERDGSPQVASIHEGDKKAAY